LKLQVRNHKGEIVEIEIGGSLRSLLNEKYNRTDSYAVKRYLESQGVPMKEVIRALGIDDLNATQVRTMLDNDGSKPLFNAIVEDGLRLGFEKESNWQALVAKTLTATQMTQTHYYLDSDEEEVALRSIGQGAPIPVGTIKVGDKTIKMHKRGRGIEWTDESKSANIDLISLWLMKLGKKLGRDYENTAVYRLLNGYFDDGYDAAPTLGLKTANDLTLGDLFYAYNFMSQEKGFDSKLIVLNLKKATEIVEMRDGSGAYLFTDEMKRGNFPNLFNSMFISNQMPDNRIMFVDTSFALVRHEFKKFGVEFERSVKTQVEGSYGTEISEFVPFEKDARLIINLDQAR
jgi:hypothetical protein